MCSLSQYDLQMCVHMRMSMGEICLCFQVILMDVLMIEECILILSLATTIVEHRIKDTLPCNVP